MMTLYMTPRQRAHLHRHYATDRIARHIGIASDVHVPVDVREEQDAFVILATLPGIEAADLDVEILENVVDIRGEFKSETEEEENYLRRERPLGSFHRRLRFASKLESANAEAALKDGILTLRILKVEEERPQSIKIKAK